MADPVRPADYERTAEEVAAAQKVYLFHEFNDVMARLYKKYGVVEVAEQCRAWAEFIDGVRAKQATHSDGSECGPVGRQSPADPHPTDSP